VAIPDFSPLANVFLITLFFTKEALMKNDFKSINLALENEIHERNFYAQQGSKATNPVAKGMFDRIAEDEQEHFESLKKIHGELSAKGTWPEYITSDSSDTVVMQHLMDIARSTGDNSPFDPDERDALKVAIDFETKGYTLYENLSTEGESPEEKFFFSRMAAMELEHFLSLRETLLYLEDPAQWFFQHEKPALEG
jgi:rubrerythrin